MNTPECMSWGKLMCRIRLNRESVRQDQEGESDFLRDYGRIQFSRDFRQLQDKTQLFPLRRNNYVRTRLTHSLEVAHIGYRLAASLSSFILQKAKLEMKTEELSFTKEDISWLVSSACVSHDIGNPPFGHSGEDAVTRAISKSNLKEFKNYVFEGNAQGLRILTKLSDPQKKRIPLEKRKGLGLTCATLAAFVKYPCTESFWRNKKNFIKEDNQNNIEHKKFGIFDLDSVEMRTIFLNTGLLPIHDNGKDVYAFHRHPLSFLVEAADDICYHFSDLEDAVSSQIISLDDLTSLCRLLLGKTNAQLRNRSVSNLRGEVVTECIKHVCDTFKNNYNEIMTGNFHEGLFDSIRKNSFVSNNKKDFLERLSNLKRKTYRSECVSQIECMGQQVIESLIKLFMPWAELSDLNELNLHPENYRHEIIIDNLLQRSKMGDTSQKSRVYRIVDYVTRMTDSYALETFQKLTGTASLGSF